MFLTANCLSDKHGVGTFYKIIYCIKIDDIKHIDVFFLIKI